jgi:hypothetical protein
MVGCYRNLFLPRIVPEEHRFGWALWAPFSDAPLSRLGIANGAV